MKVLKTIVSQAYQKALDKHERNIVNNVLKMESFQIIKNMEPKQLKKIAFVVPTLKKHAGGHTSILRLGTYLSKRDIHVSYISFHNQNITEMQNVASSNLPNVEGYFLRYSDCINEEYDVCIATSWESVYWANQLKGYKAYFVQDFEPFFFKVNERYLLAKKTYELGFHIISLGEWNINRIKENCNTQSKLDFVDFPYEPSEYILNERDYKEYSQKKELNIAVYTKEEGKRIPNLLQGLLGRVREQMLIKTGILLNIEFFGLDRRNTVSVGKNLGKLNKEQLRELYSRVDFGMVASMTNISLVPYEMLAMGLPVIEFSEGSYTDFLPENSAILVDFNSDTLVNELIDKLENPYKIENMMIEAKQAMRNLCWENTASQFYEILNSVVEK